MSIFCSAIIPTVNRSTLSRAVRSVLDQDFNKEEFEVIVVNDSGSPLQGMEWMLSKRVRVIDTNRHERSVARNTGAAVAKGRYLLFLDDDDLLLPGALNAFWDLYLNNGDAIWLNGSYQSADNHGNLVEIIHPENHGNNFAFLVAGEGIPLQASLLDTQYFFLAGCFDPKITGVEDRDLGRRLAMVGTICHAPAIVAQIRIGMEGSTTDWSTLAEGERSSRENALNLQGTFRRLWDSAKTCVWHGRVRRSYWHGRVSRAYLASMVWNLKRGSWLLALNRGISAVAFTNLHIFFVDFWLGIGHANLSPAWHSSKSNLPNNTMVRRSQLPMAEDESK